jgi:rod shape determining protein RodA
MNRAIDYSILIPALLLNIIGIVIIYAATYYSTTPSLQTLYQKQIIWIILGLVACAGAFFLPLKIHEAYAFVYYFIIVVVLIILLATSKGTTSRWFHIGSFNIQPSEIAKLIAVLAVSRYLSFRRHKSSDLLWVFTMMIIVGALAGLVLIQPDLGSSLVFFSVIIAMLFWSGLSLTKIILIISPIISLISAFHWITWAIFFTLLLILVLYTRPRLLQGVFFVTLNLIVGMITPVIWNNLHDYQKSRILTFLDPAQDPHGAGYQIIQSKIAVGSGGFWGLGFLQGTQTKLNFLPEKHTDFIFSVLAEQFGFLGCSIVLALFIWLFYRGFTVALKARNQFSSYVACGLTSIMVFQVVVNIGMSLGLMPVTGLPLPFLSYGGSSLIFFWITIGLLLAINRDWQEY